VEDAKATIEELKMHADALQGQISDLEESADGGSLEMEHPLNLKSESLYKGSLQLVESKGLMVSKLEALKNLPEDKIND
jgi:hypothetical protein